LQLIFVFLSVSDREIFPIAFSPEWPNGGFPISCAKEAATIAQNHSYGTHRLLLNEGIFSYFLPTNRPKDLPTTDTSKL
jgi:hypothetical protein